MLYLFLSSFLSLLLLNTSAYTYIVPYDIIIICGLLDTEVRFSTSNLFHILIRRPTSTDINRRLTVGNLNRYAPQVGSPAAVRNRLQQNSPLGPWLWQHTIGRDCNGRGDACRWDSSGGAIYSKPLYKCRNCNGVLEITLSVKHSVECGLVLPNCF